VSIELARRLLGSGAPIGCIDAALAAEVGGHEPFVTALLDRFPELTALVERELERSGAAEIHVVRGSTELASRLPAGMCERLLAVPVFRDPETGRVDVAAVDVLNSHVAVEFAYQLGTKVRVLRASLVAIRSALSGLEAGAAASVRSKAPSRRLSGAPHVETRIPPRPSDPPIPLVRPGAPAPRVGFGSEPPVALNLTRSKLAATNVFSFARPLDASLREIDSAESPEQLAERLAEAFEPAAALVLAVRAKAFEARAASEGFGLDRAPFSVASGRHSVFDSALRAGHYLGPLPGTLIHAELRALIGGGPAEDVYVTPVAVGGRPVLLLLLARMGPTLDATRRADALVRLAGEALSRIVRARKQR
jgi:hypothetical protein